MAVIFDGRKYSQDKLEALEVRVGKLIARGVKPLMVVATVGDNPASKIYVDVKRRTAESINCEVDVREFSEEASTGEIIEFLEKTNTNDFVHGIMVQLPLPERIALSVEKIIGTIDPLKDVDGMKANSGVVHPTARAIYEIYLQSGVIGGNVCMVGANGMVGNSVIRYFRSLGVGIRGIDKDTSNIGEVIAECDAIISATGNPNLIKGDMIKAGAVVVDVGSPKGDVDFSEVSKKASFITPVPGGVGPVTVACLLENLVTLAEKA